MPESSTCNPGGASGTPLPCRDAWRAVSIARACVPDRWVVRCALRETAWHAVQGRRGNRPAAEAMVRGARILSVHCRTLALTNGHPESLGPSRCCARRRRAERIVLRSGSWYGVVRSEPSRTFDRTLAKV
jgi:hypothetical protein